MTERPTIVLAHWPGMDVFSEADLDRVDRVGRLLNRAPIASWTDDGVDALLAEAEIVLGHWGCPAIDADMLARAPKLRYLAYTAGTIKELVTDAVWARGMRVTSGADANAEPVAEYTLAAILMANKDVFWRRDQLRDPTISARRASGNVPTGNWDKTIGLVSASIIGRRVIELLRPFPHLDVLVYDPFLTDAEAARLGVRRSELDELCAASDIVSIHAPQLPETRHLIGVDQLAAMRTGATIINTARGSILDHDALTAEIAAGRLYAILDVTDPEPLPDDHPLRSSPNVFLTPHLAGTQGTELARMVEYVIDEIERYKAGQPGRNEITKDRLSRLA